jgi:hypothetical protein
MYDSILTPHMLILHTLSLKKGLLLSKNGYFSTVSDSMTYWLVTNIFGFLRANALEIQPFLGGPILV